MSEFKVGDKVRFTAPDCGSQFEARRVERTVGTVVEIEEDDWFSSIKVDWKDDRGYSGGIGTSPKNHLEHVFKIGSTYKYTDNSSGMWFTIKLDHRSGSGDDYHTFVGTVQDRGTFYASPSFDNTAWGSRTHVDTNSLSEIEPEDIKTVDETKLPSFLVASRDEDVVVYPFHTERREVKDAEGSIVFLVSGEHTSYERDAELAEFIKDAINEKIERDK